MPNVPRNLRLDEALALPGCPVCVIVLQRVEQTMESIQDELVLDPVFREQVDAAWGFCNVHAQQWLDEAQPLSTAIIYEAVLGRISHELEQESRARIGGHVLARISGNRSKECTILVESRPCPLCVARDEQERQVIAHLLEELAAAPFRERFAESDGLCVAHLNLSLCARPRPEALEALRSGFLRRHENLRGQLREVIRKHDYRYRDEIAGPEWGAIEQSVRQVAGAPGIATRRSRAAFGE